MSEFCFVCSKRPIKAKTGFTLSVFIVRLFSVFIYWDWK